MHTYIQNACMQPRQANVVCNAFLLAAKVGPYNPKPSSREASQLTSRLADGNNRVVTREASQLTSRLADGDNRVATREASQLTSRLADGNTLLKEQPLARHQDVQQDEAGALSQTKG